MTLFFSLYFAFLLRIFKIFNFKHLFFNILAFLICGSRKNSYPSHEKSLEISRGRWVLNAELLEAMHKNKLEFAGGREWGGGG